MAILRLAATRATAVRVAPTMVRFYAPGPSEGATARSKGFQEREQASELEYIRRHEQELLKAAQDKLKAAQAEVDAAQKKVDASKK